MMHTKQKIMEDDLIQPRDDTTKTATFFIVTDTTTPNLTLGYTLL